MVKLDVTSNVIRRINVQFIQIFLLLLYKNERVLYEELQKIVALYSFI